MSSQGVNASTVSGYPFNFRMIRDSSDRIAYKRRAVIYNEKTVSPNGYPNDPWQVTSGDRRLQYMAGRFQCTVCNGSAFKGTGNPYR